MSTAVIAEEVVETEVASTRRNEIRRYLGLFGYRPDSSTLEVYLSPSRAPSRVSNRRATLRSDLARIERVRGVTILGRTRDPVLGFELARSRLNGDDLACGYIGCLVRSRDRKGRPPDELLPLDFTPLGLEYPGEWSRLYPPLEFYIAIRPPPAREAIADVLVNRLKRIGSKVDVRKTWRFVSELEIALRARPSSLSGRISGASNSPV